MSFFLAVTMSFRCTYRFAIVQIRTNKFTIDDFSPTDAAVGRRNVRTQRFITAKVEFSDPVVGA